MEISLSFQALPPYEVSDNIASIEKRLRQLAGDSVTTQIKRESATSMDLGSTIVLILGAPAVVVVAKGILEFLKRWPNKLIIETSQGRLIATGDAAKDAAAMQKLLLQAPQ